MDSIIVYRNPLEKMFWEGNGLKYTMIFAVAMFLTFVTVYYTVEKLRLSLPGQSFRTPNWVVGVALITSIVVGVTVCILSV